MFNLSGQPGVSPDLGLFYREQNPITPIRDLIEEVPICRPTLGVVQRVPRIADIEVAGAPGICLVDVAGVVPEDGVSCVGQISLGQLQNVVA